MATTAHSTIGTAASPEFPDPNSTLFLSLEEPSHSWGCAAPRSWRCVEPSAQQTIQEAVARATQIGRKRQFQLGARVKADKSEANADRMLAATLAAGECLMVHTASFWERWCVRLKDGSEVRFSETTGNRLIKRDLIKRHPREKPTSTAAITCYVPKRTLISVQQSDQEPIKKEATPLPMVNPTSLPSSKPPRQQQAAGWETEPETKSARLKTGRGSRTSVPTKWHMERALREDQLFLTSLGSSWESFPPTFRYPLLERAHEIEELLARTVSQAQKDRCETHRKRRRVALRHPGMDLAALGVPDPITRIADAATPGLSHRLTSPRPNLVEPVRGEALT
jgi:hypothetical protein